MGEKMTNDTILIPRKELLEGKVFYNSGLYKALEECQNSGYEAIFMPQLIDARIESFKDSQIWTNDYDAPSIKATGETKQGNKVVVYGHVSNYLSSPKNIEKAIEQGLVNGAGILPKNEFQRLLDLKDNKNVFVVSYENLMNSKSGVISLKDALKHPQTIPFLGGRERAEAYLEKHKQIYGDKIGIYCSDDLHEKPLGRLLFAGGCYYNLLGGSLGDDGRFVGVRKNAEGVSQKIYPTEKQIKN